jgi:uncharacterized protein YbcC (UPF0753/DUF2309 family)
LAPTDRIPVLEQLRQAIDHAAHLLPAQGPITVFIHHNTLHALEDLPFTEAVKRGATVFGCQPYLTRSRYREELRRGRIRFADLEAVLRENLGVWADEKVLRFCTRLELRLAILQYPVPFGPTEELVWFVAERDALRRIRDDVSAAVRGRLIAETRRWVMRDLRGGHEAGRPATPPPAGAKGKGADLSSVLKCFRASRIEEWGEADWEAFTLQALWRVCCEGVAGLPELALPPLLPPRHRDLLLRVTRADADLLVHDVLIRFCGAFLDQGLARWQLPRRDKGFYRAFCALYRRPLGPPDRWLRGLAPELRRLEGGNVSPLESVRESLEALGVGPTEWDDFLPATLLALRGWAGMVHFLRERGDRAVRPVPADGLVEFLAVRLLLDRLALAHVAREALGFPGPLWALRAELRQHLGPPQMPSPEQRAFVVFQLAQVLGWSPAELHRLGEGGWATLLEEVETFPAIERRRILHLAYEHRLYTQALDALALHNRTPHPEPSAPRFQAVFCIDEREESLRRHLEEVAPDAVTFGIAGFYFVPMYYRGVADAHFVPLCPAAVPPRHWVVEEVVEGAGEAHRRHARRRRALGLVSHAFHVAGRSFVLGALLSAAGGVLASVPLTARTLLPRLTARLRRRAGRFVQAPRLTRLRLERDEATPGSEGGRVGFSLDEMTDMAERVLRDMGLTSGFARLVLLLGHGSTSLNNPHESAHDCGACGGSRGGPNARAMAHILNDPRVRDRLKARGLDIPATTAFVGGMHNTSSEAVTFYDLDRLPESHRWEFEVARAAVEEAAGRDAHERCRRFESASLSLSFEAARQHVEGRAEDLAQVRPEWGHATNALCVVGRRSRTRGLFLDRRAFLNSYDPTQDDADATVLTRILQAAVPVCAGINLEYYFSYVDNPGYGCGTKLPHNIAALLGVMDGAASDLRTGLPWQMVEIHEPVRILFVVETRPETLLRVLERNPGIGKLCRNEWVRLAVLSPDSAEVQVFRDGAFHAYQPQAADLPRAASSTDWYRGWRDHLEFAEIG